MTMITKLTTFGLLAALAGASVAPVLAVVPEPPTNPLHLLMVGGGLLIVGLSLVLFLVLRARSTYQPTFISRSINQR